MRESSTATTWTCDACGASVVLTDGYQKTPPEKWRLIKLLPNYVNMALEPSSPGEVKTKVVCKLCFAAPVVMADVFSRDG